MGHHKIISLILIPLISWLVTCNAEYADYQTFMQCLSNNSQGNSSIQQQISAPDTDTYLHLLQYAEKNRRWFDLTNQRPSIIATPREPNEIRPVLLCSKKLRFQIRVKSGGHDYEGLSFRSNTKFVMIDLSNLNVIDINLQEQTAWIQTGVTLGQLYYEISRKSKTLGFPGGLYSTVGSGGHISGGGIGTLMRKYGLASDQVIDATIMDVNGIIRNRTEMGEDLFWALRGGGAASFGVVLAWKSKLVPVPEQVTGFSIRRHMDPNDLQLLQKWQNTAYKLQNDLFIRVLISKHFGTFIKIHFNGLYLGKAEQLVQILNTTYPEFNLTTQDCFTGLNQTFEKRCMQLPWIHSILYFMPPIPPNTENESILLNKGNQTDYHEKATSDFITTPIPDEGWKMIYNMAVAEEDPWIIIDPFGGKMDQIAEDATPFPFRKGTLYIIQYMTHWNGSKHNETEEERHLSWIRDLYTKMTPYVTKNPRTAYLNYKDLGIGQNDENWSYETGKVWGEKYFKGNFERLARVKGMVDPENYFKNEQSISVLK